MNRKPEPAHDCKPPCGAWMMLGLAIIMSGMLLVFAVAGAGQSEKIAPAITPPPGLKASGSAEIFSPDTLWEKINGQAEFYLSAGFVSLTSQLYENVENVDSLIEVNIYNMGSILNAFSVFSLQRRENAQVLDVTAFAYQAENAAYLVHGPFYVEIIWIQPLDGDISLLKSLAEKFVQDTPIKGQELPQLALFPSENLVRGSASMISRDAFGFDPLDSVFTAEYKVGENRATAYISNRKTDQEARELVDGLHTYFRNFGGKDVKPDIDIRDARMIEIMGSFDLMFSVGQYFAGVHEAPDQKLAEKIARELAASLQSKLIKPSASKTEMQREGLRTIDLLNLKVKDILDLKCGDTIKIKESKTGKTNILAINKTVYKALRDYLEHETLDNDDFLFKSRKGNNALQSQAVSRLVKKWASDINLKKNYGAHTLRKTFGYIQRKVFGVGFEIICKRYNHSSPAITMRYLGIEGKEVNGILTYT